MLNLKLMPKLMLDICMVDMEVMEAMVLVMAVDTDIAALVTMEDMVDTVLDTEAMVLDTEATVTTMARDLLMPNLKLMPDICMADMVMADMEAMDMVLMAVDTDTVLDTMEDMVDMVLDMEDMAASGDKHLQVVQPISSIDCQTSIKPKNCSKISQPLIQYQCLTFVKSRIHG